MPKPNPILFDEIYSFTNGTKSVLDIGCGNKAFSGVSSNVTTVDAWPKLNPDFLIDLENEALPFEENSFECVLMLDFIEHVDKSRGLDLLNQAKAITSGRIYLLTPLWWDSNEKHTSNPHCWAYGNKWNLHKSLWSRKDFPDWKEVGFTTADGEYYFGYWEKG